MLSFPAKRFLRFLGIGEQLGGISLSPWLFYCLDRFPCDALSGFDDLLHRMTLTCPQVEGTRSIAFNGFDMGSGQILNMNVIANARPIWRWVVRSQNIHTFALAQSYLEHVGD